VSSEYDVEPVAGLPALPPRGEHVLWRGAPDARSVALRALHVRGIAIYFGVLATWRVIGIVYDGGSLSDATAAVATFAVLAAGALSLLALIAWGVARTTVYTITNRRVVMRIGIALPVTFNLPYAQIDGAALRPYEDGTGDIPLQLREGTRLAYFVLWPHARPWHFARPEPMLRSVRDAAATAQLLSEALAASQAGLQSSPVTATQAAPIGRPALAAG
jgi:hypothetical protein